MSYNNPMVAATRGDEQIYAAWTDTGMSIYAHVYVFKLHKAFFGTWKEHLHYYEQRNVTVDYLRRAEVAYVKKLYKEAAEDYFRLLRVEEERAKTEIKIPVNHAARAFKLGALVGAIVLCVGLVRTCQKSSEDAERMRPIAIKRVVEPFTLVHQTTPKHYYVTLKSNVDGRVYDHHYVSKHCNNFSDNVIGETYNIETSVMFDPKTNTNYVRLDDLYRTFCGENT